MRLRRIDSCGVPLREDPFRAWRLEQATLVLPLLRAAVGPWSRWCSSACRSRASRCSSASCYAPASWASSSTWKMSPRAGGNHLAKDGLDMRCDGSFLNSRSRARRCSSASCHALKPLVVVRVRLLCSAAGAAAFRLACCCSVVPGGKTRKLAHDDPLEIQHDDHCWPPEASAMCFDDIRVRAWRLRGCSRAPRVMSRGGGHGADASQLAA